jgi:hypothetical protein
MLTPYTIPVATPTVAIAGVLLLHVPNGERSPKVVDDPWHTKNAPVITDGSGLTVTVVVTKQLPSVYLIYAIPAVPPGPAARPVTKPVALIVAIDAVEGSTVHVPPGVALLSCVVNPLHTCNIPVIGPGCVFIVTVLAAKQFPPGIT